jgi:hypothetical protein
MINEILSHKANALSYAKNHQDEAHNIDDIVKHWDNKIAQYRGLNKADEKNQSAIDTEFSGKPTGGFNGRPSK